MLIADFPAGPLAANCYVVAPAAEAECVIVDPGQQAAEGVAKLLDEYALTPAAVLLTHGHFDHCFSVAPVCDGHDIPAWVHPEDRALLSDPGRALGPAGTALFGGTLTLREPAQVRELADGAELDLAGIRITVDHTPGHTSGSVTFRTGTEEGGRLLLAGDTLFAGSIGRTDLPGGDHRRMLESLRTKVLPLPDDTVVLPGHGPATTIGRERATNPFLLGLTAEEGGAPAAPHRGL